MPVVRGLLRFVGWLLTPLAAWAASFVGAWVGAALAKGADQARTTFWVTTAFGAVFALAGAWAWLRLLRRSPKLQETLAVLPDGTPIAAIADENEKNPAKEQL
ncbi:MAG: hypothetical protein HOP28_05350 [Gemmatimonadales bacterium]|nr:hypothetical protein [Gemmatimonadales bacterium]